MWNILDSATAALEEAPRCARSGWTIMMLVPAVALFGWAVWGLLT